MLRNPLSRKSTAPPASDADAEDSDEDDVKEARGKAKGGKAKDTKSKDAKTKDAKTKDAKAKDAKSKDAKPLRAKPKAAAPDDDEKEGDAEPDALAPKGRLQLLRARFAAWWEGTDLPPVAAEAEPDDDDSLDERQKPRVAEAQATAKAVLWPRERIDVAKILWGEDRTAPGGAAALVELAAPLSLAKKMTLLHLGAGLGAGSRAIAKASRATVNGMEPDSALAAAGMEASTRLKMKSEASIVAFDPTKDGFKRAGFDCALVQDTLFAVEDKAALLERVVAALKPKGRILILDYVLAGQAAGPGVEAWSKADPSPVKPWTLDQARECLAKLKVQLDTETDETERCRGFIVQGMDAFLRGATARQITPDLTVVLKREIELWAARKEALESGELAYFGLLGTKTGG